LAGLLCIAYYLKSKNLKRKQAKYVFAGLYMPLLISLVSDFILPSASIRVPEMTMTMMTVGIGIISYGIWKYRLPALTAAVAADKIVSTMSNFLLLLDTDKNIINVNQATRNLLGYEDLELIGKSAEIIFPDEEGKKALFDVDHGLINKGVIANKETHFKAKNGVIIPVFLSISLIQSEKGEILGIVCIGSDIIDITNAKNEIRASLEEKELLLREVHHRVKNNLQIISSLLNLQSNYIKDENDLELFKDSQSRVKSMAFIHEQLYQSSSFIDIEFSEYVNNLVTYLLHYYTVEPNIIKLKTNIENVSLDLNTSIPCGLIVNELVTNSLKHAFPVTERHRPANRRFASPAKEIRKFEDKSLIPVTENHGPATGTFASPNIENREQESEIYIDLHSINDDQYILIIADNGIGIPEDIDFENTESLGLQLVNSLVMQLEGTIKLDRSAGTKFEIIFSKLEYKERL
ncbi:MAG TPA: histidine kinase dimerization/phosphoacceptor domain -containing protein, partial [Methanobacterium sp.]|nr:histidine kinase dimerization/phosphoacceptor domain -containing protein [Methanobacterium sp.]